MFNGTISSGSGRMSSFDRQQVYNDDKTDDLPQQAAVGSSHAKYAEKSEVYMNALGRYIAWNTEVDLGPPPAAKYLPEALQRYHASLSGSADSNTQDQCSSDESKSAKNCRVMSQQEADTVKSYYNALQYILYETGRPETKDKTKSRKDYGARTKQEILKLSCDRVTVVAFSSPVDCMGMLLEGGRQCPGDMLLVLSRTWLSRVPANPDISAGLDGRSYSLYVHKAIVFKSGMRSQLRCFDPPRHVTYLLNQLTSDCTSGLCKDGDELEDHLDCPTNITMKIGHLLDDKLWSRIKMAEVGVAFPETLAFAYRPIIKYRTEGLEMITVVPIHSKTDNHDIIMQNIQKFLSSPYMACHEMIVVKPSGAMWSSSVGVTFHERSELVDIFNAAIELLDQLVDGDSVLVEAYCESLQRKSVDDEEDETDENKPIEWRATKEYASRIRSTVVQTSCGRPYCSQIVCGTWYRGSAINGDNTVPSSVDTTLIMFGVTDLSERERVEQVIRADSERLHAVISDHVSTMPAEEKGAALAHCDIIGIDYILTHVNGQITPIGIEVNGPNCTVNCDMAEFVHESKAGETYGEVVQSIIHRSQCFIMRGKTIAIIGTEPCSHAIALEVAHQLGIKIITISPDVQMTNSYTDRPIHLSYDFSDHSQDAIHAANISRCIAEKDLHVDGFITFIDTCVPLVGRLSEEHSLNGPGSEAARESLSIVMTQQRLLDSNKGIPHLPLTSLYSLKQIRSLDPSELEIIEEFKYQKVSSSSVFYQKDKNKHKPSDGEKKKARRKAEIRKATRHRVCLILHKRKIVAGFVCDVATCERRSSEWLSPNFAGHLMMKMPSGLCDDIVDQMICAASQCCVEVGLISGVFCTEMWLTPTGPKLLRIDPLIESLYLRDWIMQLYGVDILLALFLIACDIAPLTFQFLAEPESKIFGFITNQLYDGSCGDSVTIQSTHRSKYSSQHMNSTVSQSYPVIKSLSSGSICPMNSCSHTPKQKYGKLTANGEKLLSPQISSLNSPRRRRPALPTRSYSSSFAVRDSRRSCDTVHGRGDGIGNLANAVSKRLYGNSPQTGLNLLKVLSDNHVIEVIWEAGDVALPRPACLIYWSENDLEVAMNKVSGVLSIVGIDFNAASLNEFIADLEDFKID